ETGTTEWNESLTAQRMALQRGHPQGQRLRTGTHDTDHRPAIAPRGIDPCEAMVTVGAAPVDLIKVAAARLDHGAEGRECIPFQWFRFQMSHPAFLIDCRCAGARAVPES